MGSRCIKPNSPLPVALPTVVATALPNATNSKIVPWIRNSHRRNVAILEYADRDSRAGAHDEVVPIFAARLAARTGIMDFVPTAVHIRAPYGMLHRVQHRVIRQRTMKQRVRRKQ